MKPRTMAGAFIALAGAGLMTLGALTWGPNWQRWRAIYAYDNFLFTDIQDKAQATQIFDQLFLATKTTRKDPILKARLADISMIIADQTEDDRAYEAQRAIAYTNIVSSLKAAPPQPAVWYNLALVESSNGGVAQSAVNALDLSIKTGERYGQLVFPRLTFCAVHWSALPAPQQKQCIGQVRLIDGPLNSYWPDYYYSLDAVVQGKMNSLLAQANVLPPEPLPRRREKDDKDQES